MLRDRDPGLCAHIKFERGWPLYDCRRAPAPGETLCKVHLAAKKRGEEVSKKNDAKRRAEDEERWRQWDAEREVRSILGNGKWTDMLARLRQLLEDD